MRTYEVVFIDVGFLASSELWSAWLMAGLLVGVLITTQQFFGSPELLARRRRRLKRVGIGWTLFAIAFSVIAWPLAVFIWMRARLQ